MGGSGLSAMIHAGAALANEFDSIEVIALGRSATAPVDDYTMEVCDLIRSRFTGRRSA